MCCCCWHRQDKANKPVALESLYVILLTYLTKHTEPGEQQTKRLSTITSHIFPPGAWKVRVALHSAVGTLERRNAAVHNRSANRTNTWHIRRVKTK
jgi:hypothetical protein